MAERAVGYFRLSKRSDGRNVSIEVQRERYLEYVAKHGFIDVGQFEDVRSGRRLDRAGYQQMLAFCREGNTDACIVMFLDRFGRDAKEINRRRYELDDYGVRVICIEEDIEAGDGLMGSVSAWKAEQESKRIGSRVRAAQERKMRDEPNWFFTNLPYGWKVRWGVDGGERITREIVLDEPAAGIIRRMAQMYLDGYSFLSVAKMLNAEGHRNTVGGQWEDPHVRWMVMRPVNSGTVIWGKPARPRPPAPGAPRPKPKPAARPPIVLPGKLPPILDPDTIRAVAERMALRSVIPPRSLGSPSILAGVIRCGLCGAAMITHYAGSRARRYRYYQCARHAHGAGCQQHMHQGPPLEAVVIGLLAPSADAAVVAAAVPLGPSGHDYGAEEAAVQRELSGIATELQRQYALFQAGAFDQRQLGDLSRGLAERRDAADQRLSAIQADAENAARRKERILTLPVRARSMAEIASTASVPAIKAAVQDLVERVTVWPDRRIEVTFRL